ILGGAAAGRPVATALVWDPNTGATMTLSATLHRARAWHSATVLPDGTVLVVGGQGVDGAPVSDVELFRLDTETVELVGAALNPRIGHTATLLTDGRLFIAGGLIGGGTATSTAQVWTPGAASAVSLPATMATARSGHTATTL